MPRLTTILISAAAGGLGGSAAWLFIIFVANSLESGMAAEIVLGGIAGACIGAFLWSREPLAGRQFAAAARRAGLGALSGLAGGIAGAMLGNSVFTLLGRLIADRGGAAPSFSIAVSVALGWSLLGLAAGASGGLMVRSHERTLYGLTGGAAGGFLGGLFFNFLSATSVWSALGGLFLLGFSIGAFISLVEETFVSAKVKVVKGRHLGREFPLLKEKSVVGRDDRSDVCLSGAEGVGLEHAIIKRRKGHYSIEANREGPIVYINNEIKRNSRLTDGDIIRVGSILLLFSAVRKTAVAAALLLALLTAGSLLPGPVQADETSQVSISQFDLGEFPKVKTYVSVLDDEGQPVRGIPGENFALQENGAPVTLDSVRFSGKGGQREPLNMAVVVDRSRSMTGEKIERAKESVVRFLSLMEPGDRAALILFNDEVTEPVPLGGDRKRLEQAVAGIMPDGHTALYDAIVRGIDDLKGIAGRRAVVVLSDGIANRGMADIDQAIAAGVRSNVSVTVIGLGEDVRTARLERIANGTGGSYYFTPSADGLAAIYETISRRMRNEYVITYRTGRRGEYLRNVSVEVRGTGDAARSYFQPGSSLFGSGGGIPRWAFAVPLVSVAGYLALSFRSLERRYRTGHLSLVRGSGSKREIDIGRDLSIGRDERNGLGLFRDENIEQRHAAVRKDQGGYVIENHASSAGTFVNGQRVAGKQVLRDGDVIDIGKTRMVFSEATKAGCKACGAAMRPGAKFCPACGAKKA